jgi:DNA-binding transcriptional LysR family regulator
MGLSIHGLRVYLCILECGSLSAAGRKLGMTQPAVSNHLHALEERFGVALLTRGRPLRATPAGECLAEHARRVLDAVSALEAELACHTAPHGPLAVGASSTPGELLMPGLVTEFSARYPDVAVELRVYDTDEAIAALLGREIEAAVVGHEVDDPRLACTVVGHDALVTVVAGSDPLAGAVAAGGGVGVVPLRTAGALEKVKRVEVRGLALSRPFVLLTERGRALSPAAEAFVATCVREEHP